VIHSIGVIHLRGLSTSLSSLWRTISSPVQDSPLALCDFRTVDPEDLVPADIVFPHYQDEAYEVLYNPDQRWFYKKEMGCDDLLLFKLGDNSADEAPCKRFSSDLSFWPVADR
jgi:hypothetical protein